MSYASDLTDEQWALLDPVFQRSGQERAEARAGPAAGGGRDALISHTGCQWAPIPTSAHPDQHEDYVRDVHALLARVLALPVITVAALQGHTFAAGTMLSLAHDLRVMRADRGFWCLPQTDINIPFTRGMSALIQARLAPQTAHEALTTARRYGGGDALTAGIVDSAVPEVAVRSTALQLAAAQASKAGTTLAPIKTRMYGPVLDLLRDRTNPRG
jgi:enoyl-CoA hydratase/carnithine racemase